MSRNDRPNRWGGPMRDDRGPRRDERARGGFQRPHAANPSDEEAMRALLSSAQSREEEKKAAAREQTRKYNEQRSQNGGRRQDDRRGRDDRSKEGRQARVENDSYYGPTPGTRGVSPERDGKRKAEDMGGDDVDKPPAQKPNFGLSGALAKDVGNGGNVYRGVLLKFREPAEARAPNTFWRWYVMKGEEILETLHVSQQSAYLIGRNADIADIVVQHPSLSGQHAVLQYRALPVASDVPGEPSKLCCKPYIMDLESTNGTFLNGVKVDAARYYELKKGDVIKFGASTREYVVLTADAKSID